MGGGAGHAIAGSPPVEPAALGRRRAVVIFKFNGRPLIQRRQKFDAAGPVAPRPNADDPDNDAAASRWKAPNQRMPAAAVVVMTLGVPPHRWRAIYFWRDLMERQLNAGNLKRNENANFE
jgi:hypothetical protein